MCVRLSPPLEQLRTMNDSTEIFLNTVKEFCHWAESTPKPEEDEIKIAIKLLADLYSSALNLPKGGVNSEIDPNRISSEEWGKILKRFAALPFNYYSVFLNPNSLEKSETGIGNLADDLADIYRDLRGGLDLCENGHVEYAIWNWRFSFNAHWGQHAVSALQALHIYASDEGIEL